MEKQPQRYTRSRLRTPKELDGFEFKPFESPADVPVENYWEMLEATLGDLKNDIIDPSKETYWAACSWCREFYQWKCTKVLKQPWRARCATEALVLQTWEALLYMERDYNLSDAMMEAFEEILRDRDKEVGYLVIEIQGRRYMVDHAALVLVAPPEEEEQDGIVGD